MQVAVSAASWVVGKALAPVTDGVLEAWAASAGLGPNVNTLKMELLYVQAMLENAHGREIRGPALKEMLDKLRQLAYGAENVLDELDYFRIQDELEGTYEATTDVDDRGIRGSILNVRHTAKAVAKQLGRLCCSCHSVPAPTTPPGEADAAEPEQGDANNDEMAAGGCVRKLASGARHTLRAAGKFFPFRSSDADDGSGMDDPFTPAPKLEFRRVEISKRMKDIVDELKPLCAKVATILNLDLPDSSRSIVQDIAAALLTDRGHSPPVPKSIPMTRSITTADISNPKFFGRREEIAKIKHDITEGDCSGKDLTVLPIVGLGGMGKTTLAQHVYKQVEDLFDVRIWICVSTNFSVGRLTKKNF